MSQIPGIHAYEKPVENDFEYVYTENKDKGFRKVTKAMMKVLLGVATKLSELENDKEFIDKTVADLENYYSKTETYSKEEVNDKISLIPKFSVKVVYALPHEDISETTIYLVPANDGDKNLYTEYINVNGLWEILGTQKIASLEIDATLTKEGYAADAKITGEKIGELQATINNLPSIGGSGVTTGQANSLWNVLKKTAFVEPLTDEEITGFKTEWGITEEEPDTPVEPDVPEVTLSSISAIYTGGSVAVGTALTDLTGITVTAHYSDGSTANVTGYTLNGEITEGENTIIVSYSGKTTTFKVTGVAESGGEDIDDGTEWTDGVPYEYTLVENEYVSSQGIKAYNGWSRTPYLPCKGASSVTLLDGDGTTDIASGAYSAWYDADKTMINSTFNPTPSQLSNVPENACYLIISQDHTVMTNIASITPNA